MVRSSDKRRRTHEGLRGGSLHEIRRRVTKSGSMGLEMTQSRPINIAGTIAFHLQLRSEAFPGYERRLCPGMGVVFPARLHQPSWESNSPSLRQSIQAPHLGQCKK